MKRFNFEVFILGLAFGLILGLVIGLKKSQFGLRVTIPQASEVNQVVSPKKGEVISNPVLVIGNLFVFENQFTISVFDSQGQELGRKAGYAHALGLKKPGPFVELVGYTSPETKEGKIEIWDTSAKDGSKEILFLIPVKFR